MGMVKKILIFLGVIIILGAVVIGYNIYRGQGKIVSYLSKKLDKNFAELTPSPSQEVSSNIALLEENYERAILELKKTHLKKDSLTDFVDKILCIQLEKKDKGYYYPAREEEVKENLEAAQNFKNAILKLKVPPKYKDLQLGLVIGFSHLEAELLNPKKMTSLQEQRENITKAMEKFKQLEKEYPWLVNR